MPRRAIAFDRGPRASGDHLRQRVHRHAVHRDALAAAQRQAYQRLVRRVTNGVTEEEMKLATKLGFYGYLNYHLQPGKIEDGATQASPESYERLAALVSYVTPLSHREACALPLLVLPPNRLQLSNPVQAVQALLTRLFVAGQPSRELAALRQLIQPRAVQQRLDAFVRAFRHALAAVWLVGVLALAVRGGIGYLKLKRCVAGRTGLGCKCFRQEGGSDGKRSKSGRAGGRFEQGV